MKRLAGYLGNEDGLAAAGNLLSFSIACNQPFYPLTVYLATGSFIGASWWTLLSTPAFLLVPAVARRHSRLGRALLVVTGTGNTLLCLFLLGEDSGVSLFFLPCSLIAALLFRDTERLIQLPLLGGALAAFIGLHHHVPARTSLVPPAAYPALWALHAGSVAMLIAFVGLLWSNRGSGSGKETGTI